MGVTRWSAVCVLVFWITGCSSPALFVANGLARWDGYQVTSGLRYGPHEANLLDVYEPSGDVAGIVVFFYGGCWGACTSYPREYYRFVAQTLASRGYVVVIPDYRQYPDAGFAQIRDDAVAAVAWVQDHIGSFGANNNALFLMGHSAGGHIAAILSVDERLLGIERHSRLAGFVGLAAPYDFDFDRPYLPKVFAGLPYAESQPSRFIDGKEPPLLLLWGRADEQVYERNIVAMRQAVVRAGGDVEVHLYDELDHTDLLAAFAIPSRDTSPVVADILEFLQRHRDSP